MTYKLNNNLRPLASVLLAAIMAASALHSEIMDLSGTWQVRLHEPGDGEAGGQPVGLPGTLDDAGIGAPLTLKPALNLEVLARLQRRHTHIGPAWYAREVVIPESWAGKRIVLELGRVLWQSRVFVDGRACSTRDSLSVPHRHELGGVLKPGRHTLVLRIDNGEIYSGVSHHITRYKLPENMPMAHAYTNHTQIMWNGVLGCVRLRAGEPVAVQNVAVRARAGGAPALRLEVALANDGGSAFAGTLRCVLRRRGGAGALAETRRAMTVRAGGESLSIDWELPGGISVEEWDEFSPILYNVEVGIEGSREPPVPVDFGFRDFTARDAEFRLNGRRVFLRGNLECVVFPLAGHPPMDKEAWRRLFSETKRWGLNHVRFHSWCPPRAAFAAADETGVYLQVELPHWFEDMKGHDARSWAFLEAEADRILAEYGSHPSFMLFSLGNELRGDFDRQNALTRRLREKDPRRLYTTTTFSFQKGHGKMPEPADEFFVTQYTDKGWIRGQGLFNDHAPSFDTDYADASAHIRVPLVIHEVGQYAVYPDLREIGRYTGNLVPLNFMAVRDDLEKKGLSGLSDRFVRASGRLAALLYKEEIERALRTPEMDGFQLLQLQDFPGQGTALVGLLNAFWEPKGFIDAAEFRRACAPVVPLARFPKAVYERGEVFRATMEVANFFRPLSRARLEWRISDAGGAVMAGGASEAFDLPVGNGVPLGMLAFPIPADGPAARLQLELRVAGTDYYNQWNFWVYPPSAPEKPAPGGDALVTETIDEALRALAWGGRVLFAPKIERVNGIPGRFVPVFWSPVHFPKQQDTMGILCDPAHPALRDFPTDFHSDWQWWDLARRSRAVILDGLPAEPVVRVIDNFNRNHSLASLFEARVGPGRLLFCAIDISSDLAARPVARQLRASLLRYISSPDFAPSAELPPGRVSAIVSE